MLIVLLLQVLLVWLFILLLLLLDVVVDVYLEDKLSHDAMPFCTKDTKKKARETAISVRRVPGTAAARRRAFLEIVRPIR